MSYVSPKNLPAALANLAAIKKAELKLEKEINRLLTNPEFFGCDFPAVLKRLGL